MLRLICYITGNNFEKLKIKSTYKSMEKVIAQRGIALCFCFLWILTGFMLTKPLFLGNSTIIGIIVAFILRYYYLC